MQALLLATALALAGAGTNDSIPLYRGLGDHSHRISTRVSATQKYFDQGLALTYGFNHGEAIRSYEEAARLDPSCAMCWWGVAYAYGPNINAAMDEPSGVKAYEALRKALELADEASPEEKAYIDALAFRYSADPKADRAALDSAYALKMGQLAGKYPQDDDALALYAEALMDLSPWDYWNGKEPKATTVAARRALETVLARNPNHAGACHFYIHLMEATYPELALPCADRLPSLMPAAGHLVHMPAHIYIRTGQYVKTIQVNEHAAHADGAMIPDMAPDGLYALGYVPHNYHFIWFGGALAGSYEKAMLGAKQTADITNRDLLRAPTLEILQHFVITPLFAAVRFRDWDRVLSEPAPPSDLDYPMAMWHWARALAFAGKGDMQAAEREREAFRARKSSPSLEGKWLLTANPVTAVVAVAAEVLDGAMAEARGDLTGAIAAYRRGVALEDAMGFDEPPSWPLMVRHDLGAALLAAGRAPEAEAVYREDLERFPENVWSLSGLETALRKQGRAEDAAAVLARLQEASSMRDVELVGSRVMR